MEKVIGFKNSWILTEEGLKKTSMLIEEDKIVSIGDYNKEELIELDDDKIVIPGFIDQHIHGASSFDFIDCSVSEIQSIACDLLQEGVTGFLATTTTQSVEVIDQSLKNLKEYKERNIQVGAELLGVHLEGPFIAKKYMGAQLPNYIIKPDVKDFKHFEEVSGNNIKLVSMAVELDEDLKLCKYLKEKDIVVSIGHSSAGYHDVKKAVSSGVSCVTHTYNGMKPLRRDDIGTVGSTFLFNELYCELICDGVHVSEPAVNLLYKNKPKDKLILISDALRTKYMPDGKYYELEQVIVLKGKEARLEDGKLAGSVLKINDAVKNLMDFANIDFVDAVKCATENPAKNLGLFDKIGSIKENKLANLVVVDKNLNVYLTIRNGNIVYKK